MNDDAAAVNQF